MPRSNHTWNFRSDDELDKQFAIKEVTADMAANAINSADVKKDCQDMRKK